MRSDIKEKLRRCLALENVSERDTVYFFIEVGKLIEQTNSKTEYGTLWFYRNWIAHTAIRHQSSYVQGLAQRFSRISEPEPPNSGTFKFVSFIELGNEVIRFLHKELNIEPSDSKTYFLNKLQPQLIQVLADTELELHLSSKILTLAFDTHGVLNYRDTDGYNGSYQVLRA